MYGFERFIRPNKGQKSKEEWTSTRATWAEFAWPLSSCYEHLHLERILVTNQDVQENSNTSFKEEYVENGTPDCQRMYVSFGTGFVIATWPHGRHRRPLSQAHVLFLAPGPVRHCLCLRWGQDWSACTDRIVTRLTSYPLWYGPDAEPTD